MTTRLVLDSSALGMLCHPRQTKNRDFATAAQELLSAAPSATTFCVPSIADYELRRKLLHMIAHGQADPKSLHRLDQLCQGLSYLPLSPIVIRRAAEFWAELRLKGQPTSNPDAIDADVILAAQAADIDGTVVTTNIRHLLRLVPVIRPDDIRTLSKRLIPVRPDYTPPPGSRVIDLEGIGPVWATD